MRIKFRIAAVFSLALLIGGAALRLTEAAHAQQPLPLRLTLQDAIHKALQANLSVLVGATRVDEAEANRTRSQSAALLPRINAQTYANAQNRNLRAFGLSLPGFPIPSVVGPFSNYDFRVYAQQNIVDLESYRNLTTLYKLAKDKHDTGTATGVDVLRAEVQLANDKQALLIANNQYKQSLLALARNLGMDPGTPMELAEPLAYKPLSQSESDALVPSALGSRADYLSLAAQRQELVEQQRASHARFYPKLSINGNFGGIGRSIGGVQATGLIQGQIDFTVFDRDREGEAADLAARVKRFDEQIADLRRGIDEDVREALLNLDSAAQQVAVAEEGQNLARRELELAQDRFESGATNNVEVVTAQDELARAEDNYILAVSSHVDAKFALARAQGNTEKNILRSMGNP